MTEELRRTNVVTNLRKQMKSSLTRTRENNHLDVVFPVPLDFGNFLQERGADCLFCSVKEKALLFYNVAVYQLRIHTLLQKEWQKYKKPKNGIPICIFFHFAQRAYHPHSCPNFLYFACLAGIYNRTLWRVIFPKLTSLRSTAIRVGITLQEMPVDPHKRIQLVLLADLCFTVVSMFKNVLIPKIFIVAIIVAVLYFLAVIYSLCSWALVHQRIVRR